VPDKFEIIYKQRSREVQFLVYVINKYKYYNFLIYFLYTI